MSCGRATPSLKILVQIYQNPAPSAERSTTVPHSIGTSLLVEMMVLKNAGLAHWNFGPKLIHIQEIRRNAENGGRNNLSIMLRALWISSIFSRTE
jgi:cellulase/cellobiase CelA1